MSSLFDAGGDGMPVVFQHGLRGDARQTREAFPEDPRFRLLTLECRGHGASPFDGEISIAAFARDVAELVESLGGPVVVGGISMGAAIATRLAVTRPDLVRGLALVRPAWIAEAAPPNVAPNAEVGALLARLPVAEARERFLGGETARRLASEAPDNLASLTGFFDQGDIAVTAALLSGIAADGPGITRAELGRIAVPTLVVGTGMDAIHPIGMARDLAGLIPGARFVEVTPKGRDRPRHLAELRGAITTFLEEF